MNLKEFLKEETKAFWNEVHWVLPTNIIDQEDTIALVSDENLRDHDTRLINFVLSIVQSEVEKMKVIPVEIPHHSPYISGVNTTVEDILTIIESLRVK